MYLGTRFSLAVTFNTEVYLAPGKFVTAVENEADIP